MSLSAEVFSWWLLLCGVSLVNVMALLWSARLLRQRQALLPAPVYAARRWQLILSAAYVLGCAYRSALPVFDVPRFCLFDSWFSSVIVGRSVATLAELCFVAQWALLLREIAHVTGSRIGQSVSRLVIPLIAQAECFSWYSVLTTSNLGHVVEETLWGLTAALLVATLVTIWPRFPAALRPILAGTCLAGLAYVAFMFLVDVPMYWQRWLADEASGRRYLSLGLGFYDAAGRWVVSHRWQDWQSEMTWMTLYFSLGVWFSLALVHAPVLHPVRNGDGARAAAARPGRRPRLRPGAPARRP